MARTNSKQAGVAEGTFMVQDSAMPVGIRTTEAVSSITLRRLVESTVKVEIIGKTAYIPHKWSEKSKRMMPGHPDKPQIRETKGVRKPEEEAEACIYRLPDGQPGIPAVAIKAAMVGGCRLFEGLTMTQAKILFYVIGEGPEELIRFTGEPHMREDTPRNSNGSADLRYRYEFRNWRASVEISYLAGLIDQESILALLDAGGRGGVGEWRPSAPKSLTGLYGQFRVRDLGEEAP
jgi:hypothetical protein